MLYLLMLYYVYYIFKYATLIDYDYINIFWYVTVYSIMSNFFKQGDSLVLSIFVASCGLFGWQRNNIVRLFPVIKIAHVWYGFILVHLKIDMNSWHSQNQLETLGTTVFPAEKTCWNPDIGHTSQELGAQKPPGTESSRGAALVKPQR